MKILIADDHSIVREGLKQLVSTLKEADQIDEAGNGNEAWFKIKNGHYDVVILDVSMPGQNGLEILEKMKLLKIDSKVLVLSVHPEEHYAIRSYKMGASGYLSKDCAYEELKHAIEKISTGSRYVMPAIAEKLVFDFANKDNKSLHEKLSEREYQVMILLAKGRSITEISKQLFISVNTISTYRTRVMEKLGMNKNAELTIYALRNNLID